MSSTDNRSVADAVLLAAWRAGDRRAGEQLIRRHFASVHGYLRRVAYRMHPALDPADLTQKTFEALVTGRDRIERNVRGYLFGIARIQVRIELARLLRTGPSVSPSKADLRDPRTSPSAAVARRQQRLRLRDAIAALPPPFAETLRRFYLEGQSVVEIAGALGVSRGTVKSRLARGRSLLREFLPHRCDRSEDRVVK